MAIFTSIAATIWAATGFTFMASAATANTHSSFDSQHKEEAK
jgi:hypothetical protein